MKMYAHSLLILLMFGLALALPTPVRASAGDGMRDEDTFVAPADPEIYQAKKAIKDKDWNMAVEMLKRAASRNANNADVLNLLGFAERNRGDLNEALKHYERALVLNPRHRGAHEYIGEAYLMMGQPAKAEEHLAALDKLCFFPCEEYSDLKSAIASYKQQHSK